MLTHEIKMLNMINSVRAQYQQVSIVNMSMSKLILACQVLRDKSLSD